MSRNRREVRTALNFHRAYAKVRTCRGTGQQASSPPRSSEPRAHEKDLRELLRRLARRRRRPPPENVQHGTQRESLLAPHAGGSRNSKKSPGLASAKKLAEAWEKSFKPAWHRTWVVKDFVTTIAGATLDTVTPAIGNALLELWRTQGYAPRTIHTRRKFLKNLLRHLIDCGGNRALLNGLTKVREPRPRETIATDEELTALQNAATGWIACWFEIAAGHGLRFEEVRKLSAADYNEANRTILFLTKGGGINHLPATEKLQEFFRTAPAALDPHTPLIERIAGRPITTIVVRRAWKKLLAKAGITRHLWPHDLRRTLAVRTMNHTHDIRDAQRILGHASLATTAHYLAHQDPDRLRPLMEQLRNWLPAPGEPKQ